MELLKPILELINQYGALAFTLALAAVMFLMFSRTWTKARDTQTQEKKARVAIQENSNNAQKIINDRVVVLEQTRDDQAKRIDAQEKRINTLEDDLKDAQRELAQERIRVADLQRRIEELERDKTALTAERDQLRTDLNSAQDRIRELESQVIQLKSEVETEKRVRETVQPIIDLLQRAIPHTGDTGKLKPETVPDTDPTTPAPNAAADVWQGDHPEKHEGD